VQPINGSVTRAGAPVTSAELAFEPAAGQSQSFYGVVVNGKYQIDYRDLGGLYLGAYKLTITHQVQKNGKPIPDGEAGMAMRANDNVKTERYVFDLTIESGASQHDFDLKKENLQ